VGSAVVAEGAASVRQLSQAVLSGDSATFEALVRRFREGLARPPPGADGGGGDLLELARRLGRAALCGDAPAFEALAAGLRRRLPAAPSSAATAAGASAWDEPATPAWPSSAPSAGGARDRAPRPAEEVSPSDFVWSSHPFNGGEAENAQVLRGFEEEYGRLLADASGDLRAPGILRATLDLGAACVKNYALDKADALLSPAVVDECRQRGMPWDLKCLQDLATLRFKQHRQPECAELLEEVASRSPPHPATQENLGTVYNSLGKHRLALECFQKAIEMKGGRPEKEDLWNLALARKNLGEHAAAIETLESALPLFLKESADKPVTIAKVHDSLAECFLAAGQAADASGHFRRAAELHAAHVGERSPLYGGAVDGLSRALQAEGRPIDAFDALARAFEVLASGDGIHPTPIYDLLVRAEALVAAAAGKPGASRVDLRRLAPFIADARANLARRRLDADGNGGVLLHKMGQVLLTCANLEEDAGQEAAAWDLRTRALDLLRRSLELMEAATEAGEADLSELCAIAGLQAGLAEARLSPDDE